MDSDHETGNSTRSVAGATRMPSDATDDDEVRERGAFPPKRFHCGQPNPVRLTFPGRSTLRQAYHRVEERSGRQKRACRARSGDAFA